MARAVDDPTVPDVGLVRALHAVHRSLGPGVEAAGVEAREAEARQALAVERLRAHLAAHLAARPGAAPALPPAPGP